MTSPSSQGTQSPETAETTTLAGPAVDNADFMSAVFGELHGTQRPIVVGVKGRINAQTRWPAGDAWEPSLDIADASRNWYFTLSTYTAVDGGYRRRKTQFAQAFGVMLDDIGTKASPRERLDTCPPSYVIETSPGNFQVGYLFDEPCGDLERVEALQEALVAFDAAREGPVRWPEWPLAKRSSIYFGALSASSAAARVCHPLPLARQRANTCGSRRRVTGCLGVATGGRPRRTNLSPSYRSASRTQDSVISGASSASAKSGAEDFFFAGICFPHADEAAGTASGRPDHHDKAGIQPTRGDEARLTIVLPVVRASQVSAEEHFGGTREIEASLSQSGRPLGGIELDGHKI